MEYLLDPVDLEKFGQELEKVPWLGFDHDTTQEYPLVSIRDYPLLRGWTKTRLEALEYSPVSDIETLSMLQSWLFFGVLEHVLGVRMRTANTLIVLEGKAFLKTDGLRPILHGLNSVIAAYNVLGDSVSSQYLNTASVKKKIDAVAEAVEVARHFNEHFVLQGRANSVDEAVYDTVVHHLALLLEASVDIIYRVKNTSGALRKTNRVMVRKSREAHLRDKLTRQGWCPSSYDFLLVQSGLWSVVYAASVGPPAVASLISHKDCTFSKCLASNVDVQTYRTKHFLEGCGCNSNSLAISSLTECLLSGSTPLIDPESMTQQRNASDLVVKFENQKLTPYVAISHVWSDGLGGCAEDGLPQCQIDFFRGVLDQCRKLSLCDAHYLWIDSMCIAEDRSLRQKAVSNIKEYFEQATGVVVLDSRLRSHSINDNTHDSLFLNYVTASWNRRIWTLQESHISNNTIFLFADGLKSWQHLQTLANQDEFPSPLATHFALELWSMKAQHEIKSIGLFARHLRWRTTSKSEDETVAIAPLLGLPTDRLSALQGEERLCEFWKLVERVPKGIVFIQGIERLTSRNFTWAPKSLVGASSGEENISLHDKSEHVTDHGLHGTWNLLDFTQSEEFDTESLRVYMLFDISAQILYWLFALEPFSRFTCDAVAFERIAYRDGASESELFGMLCLRREANPDSEIPQYSIQGRAGGQQWVSGSGAGAVQYYARTQPGARAIFVQKTVKELYLV